MRVAAALLVVVMLFAQTASACAVCMGGAASDPMNKGVSNGIIVLLGILAVVMTGFIAMFASFWRRARSMRQFRDSLRVIHPFDTIDEGRSQS